MAVNPEDNIYLDTRETAKVNSAGETLISPFCGEETVSGVAVDPVEKEVYVDRDGSIGVCGLGGAPVESFGSGHFTLSQGVAVDGGDGTVYVTDLNTGRVVFFDAVHLPTVSVGALSEQSPRGVTLNGTVNPEGLPVTPSSCVFEYDTKEYGEGEASHGVSVPCAPANPGSGTTPVAVSAQLPGLTPETTYHYRLVAANAFGVERSADQVFFTGPRLGEEFVTDVASSSASLQAPVDPNGADTHYYIQYGTSTSYGSYAPAPPPGTDLGSIAGVQNLNVHLQGLAAGTVYHYRFVVVQAGETFEGADQTFTTQGAGGAFALADDRSWEMVSPPDKHGALIEPFEQPDQIQAAADGSAITYLTAGPSAGEDPQGGLLYSQVLSRRGSPGWSSQDLTLPMVLPENGEAATELTTVSPEYHLFSPDLSLAAVEPQLTGTPLLSPEATARTIYLRNDGNGSFQPLVTPADVSPAGTPIEEPSFNGTPSKFWEMHFLTATPDLAHVVFKTPLALVPPAIDEETPQNVRAKESNVSEPQSNLYEWGDGKLELVNVLPNGEATNGPVPPGVTLAGEIPSGEGYALGGAQRAVSNDGRRIAWTWGQPLSSFLPSYKGLYVRDMVEEETVKIGGPTAEFQTMNSDGSRIFFTENGDLYVYDYDTRTQTDLTASHGVGESSAGVQQNVSDVSEDGSYVYFVANGVLAAGARPGTCGPAESGVTCNLYTVRYNGSEWEPPKLIAILSSKDRPSWYSNGHAGVMDLSAVSSRVSPDGRYLAFMSSRSLTGYDNTDADEGPVEALNPTTGKVETTSGPRADEEVYLYDGATGDLACASCNPTGARPVGVFDAPQKLLVDRRETWNTYRTGANHWLAGSIPGWDQGFGGGTYQPRYLSDGGRLFFDSPDALVPGDTNGLEDVYEFEPPGVGGCTTASAGFSERSGGCVDLISSGTSKAESAFLDASESGDDAFFVTAGQLSAADRDTSFDVYDAHVCSAGVPCVAAPVASPPCTSGDSCKAAPSPQPAVFGAPASATFSGAGNVAPSSTPPSGVRKKTVKCARGKRLRHGRCVKVKKRAKRAKRAQRAKRAGDRSAPEVLRR